MLTDPEAVRTRIARAVHGAGPLGLSAGRIAALVAQECAGVSRSTVNRRLAELVEQGTLSALGQGRARRYRGNTPLTLADIDAYFQVPWSQRPSARFFEDMLQAQPNMDEAKAQRMTRVQALANPLDRKFLTSFLVHFSWGSSVLEGSTYSALDTQALVQYGERNPDKPTEDAVLVLNHKRAIEYLWTHPGLSVDNACAIHALLTDDHGLREVALSDHFLPAAQRGVLREYQDVNLGESAYQPPFRPATGYVAEAFGLILQTAQGLPAPQAALYLMTRIPYLQAFANGNKRTARLLANYPLVAAGLLPLSFADVNKADYIRAMAAFYELRTTVAMEQVFVLSYARSVVRGSDVPLELRGPEFRVEEVVRALADFIHTGRVPQDRRARVFVNLG